jgi:hypothetical protein
MYRSLGHNTGPRRHNRHSVPDPKRDKHHVRLAGAPRWHAVLIQQFTPRNVSRRRYQQQSAHMTRTPLAVKVSYEEAALLIPQQLPVRKSHGFQAQAW